MRKLLFGIYVLAMGLLVVVSAQAHCGMCGMGSKHKKQESKDNSQSKTEIKAQTTCPVMGGKIDKKFYADHDGKRVYVCCKMCVKKVKGDLKKYIKKLEDEGVTLYKVQTKCPVMGGKIDKKLYADHDGKRAYFCCGMCSKTFKKDPAKYIKKLEDEGVTFDQIPGASEKKGQGHHKAHKKGGSHSEHH